MEPRSAPTSRPGGTDVKQRREGSSSTRGNRYPGLPLTAVTDIIGFLSFRGVKKKRKPGRRFRIVRSHWIVFATGLAVTASSCPGRDDRFRTMSVLKSVSSSPAFLSPPPTRSSAGPASLWPRFRRFSSPSASPAFSASRRKSLRRVLRKNPYPTGRWTRPTSISRAPIPIRSSSGRRRIRDQPSCVLSGGPKAIFRASSPPAPRDPRIVEASAVERPSRLAGNEGWPSRNLWLFLEGRKELTPDDHARRAPGRSSTPRSAIPPLRTRTFALAESFSVKSTTPSGGSATVRAGRPPFEPRRTLPGARK